MIRHPDVLWVQLRRWRWDSVTGVARLLEHRVHIDEVVEMHGVTYRLHSFVVHIGASPNSGHTVLANHVLSSSRPSSSWTAAVVSRVARLTEYSSMSTAGVCGPQ